MRIGAQLFTLREYEKTLADFSETLKKVSDIGYEYVQVSGTCPYEAEWLRDELKKNGLKCVITHTDPNKIKNETETVIKNHEIFGCDLIGVGCMPNGLNDPNDCNRFVEGFKAPAKAIKNAGKHLMYHNHHMEFMKNEKGILYMEQLADSFTADEMGFTLDTYWVQFGGGDPAEWIKRLSGRVPAIHLKDMKIVEKAQKMAVVGEGNINFDRVFLEAEKAGTKYLLVEQDDCGGEDPFMCMKRSYEYLKAKGLN